MLYTAVSMLYEWGRYLYSLGRLVYLFVCLVHNVNNNVDNGAIVFGFDPLRTFPSAVIQRVLNFFTL